ncbi:DUF2235 domain-containing protein [Marinobacter bryozoorum]|uniref:DUF2235 domain-containing protein n=1 Tax=Marinobacter bryozoorum TaxID=256324 RepID=UPI0020039A27|nr:DUF2235 domain-containing protein [Marinobacter bryozoorum]MCK7544812.1 DUF2235 domain-containing protein [Marinobacter bryozoorum]
MKQLVICADGTWQSPESDTSTHVLRLAEGIAPLSDKGVPQVVFYDWGVGSDGDALSGGVTGAGIDKNIMDCYRFLVHNYDEGDAIYLFGFSRGAYTVRSLAGLIRNCGILRRCYADQVASAYKLYRQRGPSSAPWKEKASKFRQANAVADVSRIHFMGVFDTVGSLGIPAPFLGTLGTSRYLFHDTEPSSIINHARHAVSIDENRQDFEPTLWTPKDGIDLEQVWFAGVHTDVGGGYPDRALGDHAGLWLAREAERCGLAFARHFLACLEPDHCGRQHNEYKGFYRVMRRKSQRKVEPVLHQSVRDRWEDDAVEYKSPALKALLDSVDGDWGRIRVVE